MIEVLIETRENLRAVVSLVDLSHDPSRWCADVRISQVLYEIPVIIGDLGGQEIPRGKWQAHESNIKKKLNFDKWRFFILFICLNKAGGWVLGCIFL